MTPFPSQSGNSPTLTPTSASRRDLDTRSPPVYDSIPAISSSAPNTRDLNPCIPAKILFKSAARGIVAGTGSVKIPLAAQLGRHHPRKVPLIPVSPCSFPPDSRCLPFSVVLFSSRLHCDDHSIRPLSAFFAHSCPITQSLISPAPAAAVLQKDLSLLFREAGSCSVLNTSGVRRNLYRYPK